MSAAWTALFFSHHALDMMPIDDHLSASRGSGTVVSISTRRSLTFLIDFSVEKLPFMFDPGPLARLIEKTTSSAVNGVPSLNFTLGRRSKYQWVGSVWPHFTASAGSSFKSLSRRVRPS